MIAYTITPEEFLAAKRLHMRIASWILRAIIVVMVIGYAAAKQHTMAGFLLVCGVMLPGILLGLWLGSKWDDWRFMRQFHQNQEFQAPMTVGLVAGELVVTTDKSTSSIPRVRILKIRSNRMVTLLYRSSAVFHVIPTRVITKEIADFLGLPAAQESVSGT